MCVIIITGTPGTGKTTLARKLADKLHYTYFDVGSFIKTEKLADHFDAKRKTYVVDIKKLNFALKKELSGLRKNDKDVAGIILDSHLSHYFDASLVSACIVTTCDLKILEGRLKKRKYSAAKIRENLDAEIFEICRIEAQEAGLDPILIDTTKRYSLQKIIKQLEEKIKN